jgi:hypothetical protein
MQCERVEQHRAEEKREMQYEIKNEDWRMKV